MEWLQNITHGHAEEAIIIAVLLLIVKVLISVLMASYARKKGYNDLLIFVVCFIFDMLGYVISAALPDRVLREEIADLTDALEEMQQNGTPDAGILPDTNDERKPAGTTAYMPSGVQTSGDSANAAVELIKKYWGKTKK